jgi:hypothetical protein
MNTDGPHVTSHQELQQCIADLEEFFEGLADVNAGVSKVALRKLHQIKKLMHESSPGEAQIIVRAIGRVVCHEVVAEAVKWILETLIRTFPALPTRVKVYDTWFDHKGIERFRRPKPTCSGPARWHLGVVSIAA